MAAGWSPLRFRASLLLILHLVSAVVVPVAHAVEEAAAPVPFLHVESEGNEKCPTQPLDQACLLCRAGHGASHLAGGARVAAFTLALPATPSPILPQRVPTSRPIRTPVAPRAPPIL
jgi:hypothetical protein